MSKEKRIYNVDTEYVNKKLEEYKEKTGVGRTTVFAALGRSESFLGNVKRCGVSKSDLYRLCVLLGLSTDAKAMYIGGEPVYEKIKDTAPDDITGELEELKRTVLCVASENRILKERVEYLEKELGVHKPKEVGIVKKVG